MCVYFEPQAKDCCILLVVNVTLVYCRNKDGCTQRVHCENQKYDRCVLCTVYYKYWHSYCI